MKIKIPLRLVEPEDDSYHLAAASVFEDGTTGFWVVDTGASKSVFDKNLKDYFIASSEKKDTVHTTGITDKPLKTTLAYMKPFSIGKLNVPDLEVALIDLTHINDFYPDSAEFKICGMLGGDFLMEHEAIIDYQKKILILKVS
jgi:hypothetical protein